MKKLPFTIIIILFANSILFACSMAQGWKPPIFSVNDKQYVFVGEVIGYTETIESKNSFEPVVETDKFWGSGKGYKIKPVSSVNLPNMPVNYFELYKFGVTTWCAPKINDAYLPVGTKLRIFANEATLLPNRSSQNHIRLESKIFDRLTVASNFEELTSDEFSDFDYKKLKPYYTKFIEKKDYEKLYELNDLVLFEIYKNLFRLKEENSPRFEILERLLYAPGIDFDGIVNSKLIKSNDFMNLLKLDSSQNQNPEAEKTKKIKEAKLTNKEKEIIKRREEILKSEEFKYLNDWIISY